MNVSIFYLFIGSVLIAVFFLFKPLKVDIADAGELAQIELTDFRIHELTTDGIKTVLTGSEVKRFENRYEVRDINLTDQSDNRIENVQADRGVYKDPMIYLNDHVQYSREDGIVFKTNEAEYNRTSGAIITTGLFELRRAQDSLDGYNLSYNTKTGQISAKQIEGSYLLKEDL